MNANGNALEVKNLCKKYKDFELKNVSFSLPYGCIMGFIGENGAGKSTTIKAILNCIFPNSGEITILGKKDGAKYDEIKEQIGVVMDESLFHEVFTAKNVNSMLKSIYKTWDEKKFFDYLKKFDITADKKLKDYSRGMKMKLGIAVAMSHDSKLLILDEATSGLDPIVRDEILDIFLDYIADGKKSVFISSHIISDLEKISDYIVFIHKGEIKFSEEKDVLLEKYGILKCSPEEFKSVYKTSVVAYKENKFGIEALVLKDGLNQKYDVDKAGIEDIMLFTVKGAEDSAERN